MFYLIMNVFPYSGFMALHLLNGEVLEDSNGDSTGHNGHYITAAAIGPYAGILASSFRLGRIPTAIPWGRCADVYGRKFTLIVGILAMIAGNILFAIAPTFSIAVGIRFCTGLLNGTMVVARTSISEIAKGDPKLESRGVAIFSSVSGYAMLIGPAIGGLLSNPIRQYPTFFHKINEDDSAVRLFCKSILEEYPFLLPNMIGSIVASLSLVLVIFCVEETLPENKRRDWRLIPMDCVACIFSKTRTQHHHGVPTDNKTETDTSRKSASGTISNEKTPLVTLPDSDGANDPTIVAPDQTSGESTLLQCEDSRNQDRKSTFGAFLDPTTNVRFFFYSMWLHAFSSLASMETFPLFAMASITKGGLGLDETGIGIVSTIGGFIFIAGQYTAFSTTIDKLGVRKAMQFSSFCRTFIVLLYPLGLYFSHPSTGKCSFPIDSITHGTNENSPECIEGINWYQFGFLGLVRGSSSILGSIFMGSSTIGVNGCIIDASMRASMNGLQSMVASMGRGLGPIVAGYLVAASMTSGVIPATASAWVVYGVLMVIESVTHLSTRMIPETGAPDFSTKNENTEEIYGDEHYSNYYDTEPEYDSSVYFEGNSVCADYGYDDDLSCFDPGYLDD